MAKKKSKSKIWILIVVILVLIILLGAAFVLFKGNNVMAVTVGKVERKNIVQTVSAIGKIDAETEVKISSETSGEIIYLGVHEGDTVKQGTILVKIKPDIVESMLEQAQAAADASKMGIDVRKAQKDEAEISLKRITELYKKQFASNDELDKAKSAYDQAVSNYQVSLASYQQSLANFKEVKNNMARTTIISPINGIITKLSVEKGEKVVGTAQYAGTELMVVSDLNVMNAMVDVDENDIINVKTGDTTIIEVDAIPDKKLNGVVIEIGHSAAVSQLGTQDQVTNFKVKVRITDRENRLRPGMSCSVDIQTQTREKVLAVPLQAVTVRENQGGGMKSDVPSDDKKDDDNNKKVKFEKPPSVVFVKDGNKVKMTTVKTGISDKGFIEITEGLNENQEIVTGNYLTVSKLLQDGSIVRADSLSEKFKSGEKK